MAIALMLLSQASCIKKSQARPKIIVVFADYQSYNTIHAHGNDEIKTPNLDRLTEKGITYTHANNVGS